jgi:hypothetical protein
VPVPGDFTVPRFTVATAIAGALLALAMATLVFALVRELNPAPTTLAAPVNSGPSEVTVLSGVSMFATLLAVAILLWRRDLRAEWRDLLSVPQPWRAAWYVPSQRAIYPEVVQEGDAPIAGVTVPAPDGVVAERVTVYGPGQPGDLAVVATENHEVANRLEGVPTGARWLWDRRGHDH